MDEDVKIALFLLRTSLRLFNSVETMPKILKKILGLLLLVTTIGLATCQSFSKAASDIQPTDNNTSPIG